MAKAQYNKNSSQASQNKANTNKTTAFYLRVSKNDQTTENQKLELERVAQKSNWNIYKYYVDTGISGINSDRPEFLKLQKAILQNKIDLVAAWSVCRLGRSLQDLVNFLKLLNDKGVDLYLHQQGIDTRTSSGKAMFQMIGVFSEFEHSIISERVKAGLERAKSSGTKLGRPIIFEEKVQDVLSLRAGGMSMLKIAKKLNIGTGTVQKILKTYDVSKDIEKSIELDLWLMVENNSKFARGKTRVRQEIEDYLNSYYDLEKPYKDSWDYKLTIKYTTEEELDNEIEEIIHEMSDIADMKNCFIEHSINSEKLDKGW
jgi:DNA invertase Pin-like site-specific DNA recombinase